MKAHALNNTDNNVAHDDQEAATVRDCVLLAQKSNICYENIPR